MGLSGIGPLPHVRRENAMKANLITVWMPVRLLRKVKVVHTFIGFVAWCFDSGMAGCLTPKERREKVKFC